MIRPHHSIPDDPKLTISDVLATFDDWDPEARRGRSQAYVAVVLFNAGRVSFETLVRAVLTDYGRDPAQWQEHAATVEEAFQIWVHLDAPYVAPRDSGPEAGRTA
jgi:hypothetical protein